MKTETLEFNWAGETAKIVVTEFAGMLSWEQCGYKLQVRNRKEYDDFAIYEIWVDGQRTDNKVGKMDHEAVWEATNWDGSMTRHNTHVAAAASKLMFNLL